MNPLDQSNSNQSFPSLEKSPDAQEVKGLLAFPKLDHKFKLQRSEFVAELSAEVRIYEHVELGTRVLHVATSDVEKVFACALPVRPPNSRGGPHGVEHWVMSGSKNFPLQDPNMAMAAGSLSNSYNGLTYEDKTIYVVSNPSESDFLSQIHVMLDGVFHPLLRRENFFQQICHREISEQGRLIYNGVVLNEMSAHAKQPASLIATTMMPYLFPDTDYRFSAAGKPDLIPELSPEEATALYKRFYHPSKVTMLLWGDFQIEKFFHLLEEQVKGFERVDPEPPIEIQQPLTKPIRLLDFYNASVTELASSNRNLGLVTLGWVLPEPADLMERVALNALMTTLFHAPSAPMSRALVESGAIESVVGYCDFNGHQPILWIECRGVREDFATQVDGLIFASLRRLAKAGIHPLDKKTGLNLVDHGWRKNDPGDDPKGYDDLVGAYATWVQGGDPIESFKFEAPMRAVERRISEEPRFLESRIEQALLENKHMVSLILLPDNGMAEADEDLDERIALVDAARLNQSERQEIIANQNSLTAYSETPDSVESIVALSGLDLSAISRLPHQYPTIEIPEFAAGVRLMHHNLATRGLVYADIGFDLSNVSAELRPLAKIVGVLLSRSGTSQRDELTFNRKVYRVTTGLSVRTETYTHPHLGDTALPWLFIDAESRVDNAGEMLEIVRECLFDTVFENPKVVAQIVREERQSLEESLIHGPLAFARLRVESTLHAAGKFREMDDGLSQILILRALERRIEDEWSSVRRDLESFRRQLCSDSQVLLSIAVDQEDFFSLIPLLRNFSSAFTSSMNPRIFPSGVRVESDSREPNREGFRMPIGRPAFAKGIYLDEIPSLGAALVAESYLDGNFLSAQVARRIGAYTAQSWFDPSAKIFACLSSENPAVAGTLGVFDRVPNQLSKLSLSDAELSRWKISALSKLEPEYLPWSQASASLDNELRGRTFEQRRIRRSEILDTTIKDIRDFGNVLGDYAASGNVVVFGGKRALSWIHRDSTVKHSIQPLI